MLDSDENKPKQPLLLKGPTWPALDFFQSSGQPDETRANRFLVNGVPVYLEESGREDVEEHTKRTAFTVWDCSLVLAKYLEKQKNSLDLDSKRVLELGSGKGIVGISSALLGAKEVLLTDVSEVVSNLEKTVALNKLTSTVRVKELDWTDRSLVSSFEKYDLIVAADVVWVDWLIEPLVETIFELSTPDTTILLGHLSRSSRGDEHLFRCLKDRGFVVTKIPAWELDYLYSKDEINIYHIKLSP
ncbi:S-adenosyl-L-methionine-dependent methyltransferase [Basidiobolus meristosporus CBS 931.73]|uniref:S-adenosyl-L-methionine-dependent methyltransferase n=1 Tax=Basidiobolus meristosporus CBS 931.73 TaxID=1314790 RepID=A0A1Y1X1Y3_9FUNG|nr:S-adenosyl-L-methionine-dependent methyltransferase [Basidiobolus meristosporus CBS 931.73]|eukprot:ORX79702.1 S-adenosyl-L-methionine-dependent methyltransferase [Basidiobolus meristosporus CBS 931.73]